MIIHRRCLWEAQRRNRRLCIDVRIACGDTECFSWLKNVSSEGPLCVITNVPACVSAMLPKPPAPHQRQRRSTHRSTQVIKTTRQATGENTHHRGSVPLRPLLHAFSHQSPAHGELVRCVHHLVVRADRTQRSQCRVLGRADGVSRPKLIGCARESCNIDLYHTVHVEKCSASYR